MIKRLFIFLTLIFTFAYPSFAVIGSITIEGLNVTGNEYLGGAYKSGSWEAGMIYGNKYGLGVDTSAATQGSILYRGATNWTYIAPGTSELILKAKGLIADPAWGTTGNLVSVEVLTTVGTYDYTVPAGATAILVECVAGGGGGGGVLSGGGRASASGGGGGGSYSRKLIISPAAKYACTVGGGGTGGAATPTAGANGGYTTFESMVCNGGSGGPAGADTAAGWAVTAGGAGGAVSTGGNVNIGGDAGGYATIYATNPISSVSGRGGLSYFGGGAASVIQNVNGASAGSNAVVYGSGGSGGASRGGFSAVGGNGSQGIIVIWIFK